ncbi:hypothetical protein EX349_25185 [Pseudomonas protegens]|nr:hypothetical protein [Pseudomonas sp. JV245A]NAN54506.1 hypothetical protein [Pseudomonas protegens]NUE77725.1 hypothetical protein [Pseudomonas protegens]
MKLLFSVPTAVFLLLSAGPSRRCEEESRSRAAFCFFLRFNGLRTLRGVGFRDCFRDETPTPDGHWP